MEAAAIFGAAGPVGRAVAAELERRSAPYRAVGRSREKLEAAFAGSRAEIFPADLGDLRAAGAAARGCDTIFYCVGVPYTAFHLHPALMQTTVEAAVIVGVQKLIVVSSVYSYGVPQTPKVSETHPRQPHTYKGRMRKQQEDIALEAQQRGRIQSLVLRLPDFYGPHANNSLANPILRAALSGKPANWIGPLDTPHEFVYVPDAAAVLVALASRADAFGEAWNYGGPGAISGRGFIEMAFRTAGREPRFRTAGHALLTVAGWFNPLMRELKEMLYLMDTPVLLDDSKLKENFGELPKTSYAEGVRATMEWMQS